MTVLTSFSLGVSSVFVMVHVMCAPSGTTIWFGRVNVPPTEGGQFFGEAAIEGRSGVLTVMLKDMAGATLWQRSFEPERG